MGPRRRARLRLPDPSAPRLQLITLMRDSKTTLMGPPHTHRRIADLPPRWARLLVVLLCWLRDGVGRLMGLPPGPRY